MILFLMFLQVPDQYGTIRAVAEGKGDQFLVGTSRNFILRGTFNDGFQVEVQVSHCSSLALFTCKGLLNFLTKTNINRESSSTTMLILCIDILMISKPQKWFLGDSEGTRHGKP